MDNYVKHKINKILHLQDYFGIQQIRLTRERRVVRDSCLIEGFE